MIDNGLILLKYPKSADLSVSKKKINTGENNSSHSQCTECGGKIVTDSLKGETTCNTCGLVHSEKEIDITHMGRNIYNEFEALNRGRVGNPIHKLNPDMSLNTIIRKSDISDNNFKRIARRDSQRGNEIRNLLIALFDLKRISSKLQIPRYVRENAFMLYKKALKNKLIRGRSIEGILSACIYYACRIYLMPLSIDEIVEESIVEKRELKKCYGLLIRQFNLRIPPLKPSVFIDKYCSLLKVDRFITKLSILFIETIEEKGLISGKNPKGYCAGAIYLASVILNSKLIQKEMAKVIKITEVTIRSRYKEMTIFMENNLLF